MTLQFKNNASTTLSGSINNTQTSITVASGSSFPALAGGDYFYATMYEVSGATEINIEIVRVTATLGNNWTVVRGQDGTTARSRDGITTCYVENRYTAASALQMLQKDNDLSDLTSAATARTNLGLGSMATQAASSVNITGGTISGVTFSTIDSSTTIQDNVDATKKVAFEVSGVSTGTTRTLTVPNASGTIALTSDLSTGYQPLDSDLTAIAGLAANGLVARTGTGTAAVRTISQPAAGITVTNGDGVSGNPTLALANDLLGVESLNTTGFVRRTAADTWSASAIVDADLPGALTGKTYNSLTLTSLATGFSVAGGTTSKTLTLNKTLTLDGTDGVTVTFPATSGTLPLNNQTFFLGTTSIAINRPSGALTLAGVSIDGSAGSASTATSATTATNIAGGVANQIHYQTGAGATSFIAAPVSASTYLSWNGTGFAWASPGGGGTVTSVGITSSDLSVSGSPVTGSGSITLGLNTVGIAKGGTGATTKTDAFDALSPATTLGDLIYSDGTDNVRLAGNTTTNRRFLRQTGTGSVSAAPAWDSLQDGDVPSSLTGKTYNGLTLTAASTGFTVAGGTTSKTLTVSNTLTLSGTDSSTLNIGTGGTLGTAAFTASTAYSPAAGSSSITTVGTISSGTWQGSTIGITYGGTGATTKSAAYNALTPITTLGDIVYGDGANSATRLAGNTAASKRFLTQTGNGTVSAAPGWNAIVDADLPSALTGKTYNALTLTANATGFQIAGGTTSKTLAVSNNLTLSGTDGSTLNIGGGGTLGSAAYTASTAYQAADADLAAIAALAGTSGLLRKTAADTWSLDTNTYLTGNQSISISGDASGSGSTAISLTLANTGVTAGTYNNVTVNSKGLVTGASNASYLTGNQTITLSGDVSGSGATAISVTLGTVSASKGGTGQTAYTLGDILYASSGSALTKLAGNITAGKQFLSQTGTGTVSAAPAWATLTKSDVGLGSVENTALSTWAGSSSITTLGTVGTGTWQATVIGSTYGGTGVNNGGRTLTVNTNSGTLAFSNASTTLTVANTASVSGTNTGDQTITLTGDVTGSGTGSFATTLANSGVTAGTYSSVTVDGKGRVTAGSNPGYLTGNQTISLSGDASGSGSTSIAVTIGATAVTGKALTGYVVGTNTALAATDTVLGAFQKLQGQVNARLSSISSTDVTTALGYTPYNSTNPSGYITGNQSITISGDASGTGSTAITLTLGNSGVTAGTYNNNAAQVRPFTVDAKGRVTAIGSAVTITPDWSSIQTKPTTLSGYGITDAVATSGDQTVGGIKNFSSVIGVGGQAGNSGNWTTVGWTKAISMAAGQVLWWPKGSNTVSKGIGSTGDEFIYFAASTADSGAAVSYPFQFHMSNGDFTATGNVTAYSDRRLKKDIEPIRSALDKVLKITGVSFTRIENDQRGIGVIAQDVQEVFPEAVIDTGSRLSVAYGNLVGPIIEALREIDARLKALEA